MLNLPSQTRVFLAVEPVDLRKQFDGLWAVAQQQLGVDPFGGAFFVFRNRACNRLKILYWDGSGVWVFAKRLEQGTFSWPRAVDGNKVDLTPAALTLLLSGIDLKDGQLRPWYQR